MNNYKKGTTTSQPYKTATTGKNLQRTSQSPVQQTQKTRPDLRKTSISKSPSAKQIEEDDDCNIPDETPR